MLRPRVAALRGGMNLSGLFSLSGRVAIITGAGSGIGRSAAQVLCEMGATVVGTDISVETVQETVAVLDGRAGCLALQHDVTSAESWAAVIAEVQNRFGRLDVLVNNAGIMLPGYFMDAPVEHLRRQYLINVEGPFLGMQAAIPLMKASVASHDATPSIINVSSVYGQIAGDEFAAYSASKGAIRMLSRAVGAELAYANIRVNSLHPGPTRTNLSAGWSPPRDRDGNPIPYEEYVASWIRKIPMGRMGEALDAAAAIGFLASDASRFMTGSEVIVDGGYTAV